MRILGLIVLAFVIFWTGVSDAGEWYRSGNILYWKYRVPYQYVYCGRPYTAYKWKYKQVLDYDKGDWRQQALKLIDQQKERESFEKTLTYLGAQGIMGSSPTFSYGSNPGVAHSNTQATAYPSATGTTVGGFTSYEYSRYGYKDVTPLDQNRAQEIIGATIDQFNRSSAENARRGDEIHASVGTLIDKNSERVAAIAEAQEMRAAVREMSQGMKEMFIGFSEATKAMKPQPSESLRYESGHGASQSQQQDYSQQGNQPQRGPVPPPPPQQNQGGGVDLGEFNQKYCAACHDNDPPAGNYRFWVDGKGFNTTEFGSIALRMDPNAPATRAGTQRPYRMPPENSPQPSLEERRAAIDAIKVRITD